MKVVCLSDTHERHEDIRVPEADLLLHAGDFTFRGEAFAIIKFNSWLHSLPHKNKVVIAGNHDFLFQNNRAVARSLLSAATYLEDSGTVIDGLKIWGTPWQPWFHDWAFNLISEAELKEKFDLIPEGTDILIAHSPPKGILDRTGMGVQVGSSALLEAIYRIKPRLVVFGHVHEAYGITEKDQMIFVNACNCNLAYHPVNRPIVVEL